MKKSRYPLGSITPGAFALWGLVSVLCFARFADASGSEALVHPARGEAGVPDLLRGDALLGEAGFKYRIMVDKTRIGNAEDLDRAIKNGTFAGFAKDGFNIISPRNYFRARPVSDKRLQMIERAAEYAGDLGMYYLQWQRGSFNYRAYDSAPDTRFVHRDGVVYDAVSPSSERFWELLEQAVLPLVRISARQPLMGVFFDFEKYAPDVPDGARPGFVGHWYPPSYGDAAWERFFADRGGAAPERALADRAAYLERRGMDADFREHQYAYWRERARELRDKVDAINPAFRFAVYSAAYTDFINQAFWKALGTEAVPLLAAEHYTYGRGNPLKDVWGGHWKLSDDQALQVDNAYLKSRERYYSDRGPHVLLGGIATSVRGGESPKLVARKAHLYATNFDGYWVWYDNEGPEARIESAYDRWFRLANETILRGGDSVLSDIRDYRDKTDRAKIRKLIDEALGR